MTWENLADRANAVLGITGVEEFSSTSKAIKAVLYVWNTSTLAWERMQQPVIELSGDLTVTMGDVEKLLAGNYWKDQRMEYSGGNLLYRGLNTTHKTATSATSWYIWKYTFSGEDLVRIEGPLTGAWDNRASLAWA